jgi:hypothetical protein
MVRKLEATHKLRKKSWRVLSACFANSFWLGTGVVRKRIWFKESAVALRLPQWREHGYERRALPAPSLGECVPSHHQDRAPWRSPPFASPLMPTVRRPALVASHELACPSISGRGLSTVRDAKRRSSRQQKDDPERLCQNIAKRSARPIAYEPPTTDGTRQRIAHAVLDRQLVRPTIDPMGSSICIVSVHVQAMRLQRAIITPGSNSCFAISAYSFHQPSGTDECRKTSLPSRVERQSDVWTGMRAAPRTLSGRSFDVNTCSASSTSFGVWRVATTLVSSVRRGVARRPSGNTLDDTGSLHG